MSVLVPSGWTRPRGLPATCTDEELFEAVELWLLGEKPTILAELLHVKPDQLRQWIASKSWQALAKSFALGVQASISSSLTRLKAQALVELADRVNGGDYIVRLDGTPVLNETTGVPVRRPMRGRDLLEVFAKVSDCQLQLEKAIGNIKDDTNGQISLEKLAAGLAFYARQAKGQTFDSGGAAVESGEPGQDRGDAGGEGLARLQ